MTGAGFSGARRLCSRWLRERVFIGDRKTAGRARGIVCGLLTRVLGKFQHPCAFVEGLRCGVRAAEVSKIN